jgi:hypothetical protein
MAEIPNPRTVLDYHTAGPTLTRFHLSNAPTRAVIGPIGSGKLSAWAVELLRRAKEQKPGPVGIPRPRAATRTGGGGGAALR